MLKKIESLRTKPKEVRNRYAFWFAFSFTAMIAVFWLVSLPSRLGVLTDLNSEPKMEIEGGVSRSFSDLRASIANGVSTFNKIKKGPAEVSEEFVETKDGEIDFINFFSTSSLPVDIVKKQGKPVLIGTSSNSQSTSISD